MAIVNTVNNLRKIGVKTVEGTKKVAREVADDAAMLKNFTAEEAKRAAEITAKGGKKVATYAADNSRKVAKGTVTAVKNPKEAAARAGKATVKSTFLDVKNKDGEIQKNLGNLWTGKKLNPAHLGVAGGAYLGGQMLSDSVNFNTRKPLQLATMNNYEEYGSPDVLSYDGVSQQASPKNLNANGSLVFGLHNQRKG